MLGRGRGRATLVIDRPSIDRSIDITRIARVDGVEVQHLAGATWVDRPAAMIEPLIIQSFRSASPDLTVANWVSPTGVPVQGT